MSVGARLNLFLLSLPRIMGSWAESKKKNWRVAIAQLGLYVLEMLPPSALVHWSSDSVWRKEELAAVTKLPSATELFVNAWFDAYGILNEHPASEISAQPYELHELLGRNCVYHVDSYVGIQKWLVDKIRGLKEENIYLDKAIQGMTTLPALGTTLYKRPDVAIYDADDDELLLLVQIEVDSGDLNKTARKLSLRLIDQLRWQRNHQDTILTCTGFYFPHPCANTKGYVQQITRLGRQLVDVLHE